MGMLLHARERDGEIVYRAYSTFWDEYVTDPMPLRTIRRWFRREALYSALQSFRREWPRRVERAMEQGTSDRIGRGPGLTAPWDAERVAGGMKHEDGHI